MEKRVVHFYSEGSRLEGDLFLPSDLRRGEKRPGLVLCHGFTGIRELVLPEYAKVFTEAGCVSLTFDSRGCGGSEGQKWRLIPLEQSDDLSNASTLLHAPEEEGLEPTGVLGGRLAR